MYKQKLVATESYLIYKLNQINEDIDSNYVNYNQPGGLAGISGLALFKFYYARFTNDLHHAEIGVKILDNCIKSISDGFNYHPYCSGIAGMAFTFNHLSKEGFIDNIDVPISSLDESLMEAMISDAKKNKFDFLHQATGYAYYFLKRYENTADPVLKINYRDYLLKYITILQEKSEIDGPFVKWNSSFPKSSDKNKEYDLGLAHGMPSIVNLLSRMFVHEEFNSKVDSLINGSILFMLSVMDKTKKQISLFPDKVNNNGHPVNSSSRLGWCYGDLGVAMSLWIAHKNINSKELGQQSLSIFKHTVKRMSLNDTQIMDGGLCHGAFGVAQIYNRIYLETLNLNCPEPIFKKSAEYWINFGVNQATNDIDFAGFKEYKGPEKPRKGSHFVLDGISGIGLSIMGNLSSSCSNWDSCLMLS